MRATRAAVALGLHELSSQVRASLPAQFRNGAIAEITKADRPPMGTVSNRNSFPF